MDTHTYRDDEYVSVGDAARILGVSVATVRRYEDRGLITATRTLGNQRRYLVGDLRAAVDQARAS
jgi:MerR family redox-sensitive transcriptional activator SoxR